MCVVCKDISLLSTIHFVPLNILNHVYCSVYNCVIFYMHGYTSYHNFLFIRKNFTQFWLHLAGQYIAPSYSLKLLTNQCETPWISMTNWIYQESFAVISGCFIPESQLNSVFKMLCSSRRMYIWWSCVTLSLICNQKVSYFRLIYLFKDSILFPLENWSEKNN